MQRILSALVLLGLANAPATAEVSEAPLAIVGVTLHEAGLPVVADAAILIVDGRIAAAGAHLDIPTFAERLDATGLHAYPGFIDADANLGIPDEPRSPEERARFEDENPDTAQGPLVETRRANRRGIRPQWRAEEVFDPSEDDLAAHRRAGFTTALVGPRGGLLGGHSALIQLGDTPRRRAVLLTDFAQHGSFSPYEPGDYPRTPLGSIAALRQFFYDVSWYRQLARLPRSAAPAERLPVDPALAAGVDVGIGAQVLIFEAQTEAEILRALKLAEEFELRLWISGGREAYKVQDILKARGIPVIASLAFEDEPVAETHEANGVRTYWEPQRLREERLRLWREQVTNVQSLAAAGVDVALSTRGAEDLAAFQKNLRTAVQEGLDPAVALTALTDTPAKLVGLRSTLGVLTPGALANVVLFDKPFEEEKAKARYVFIDGRRFEYEDKPRDADDDDADDDDAKKDADSASDKPSLQRDDETIDDPHRPKLTRDEATDVGTPGMSAPPARDPLGPDTHGPSDVATTGVPTPAPDSTEGHAGKTQPAAGQPREPGWRGEIEADRKPELHTGGNVFIRGATVLPMDGAVLKDASILVRGGRIEAIGTDLTAPDGIAVLDATGLFVMPGIIDCHSHMALDAVNEGVLSVSAEVRVGDVIDPRQVALYRALAGGVTTIHTMHGSANTIGGECVVLKLRYGKSADELRFAGAPRTLKFALGENVTHMNNAPRGDRFPHTRMGVESVLRQALTAAGEYRDALARHQADDPPIRRDLRLEALADVLAGEVWVHCHGYRADEYLRLIDVAESFGFRIGVMQHCLEAYRIVPEIARHGCGVSTFANDWAYKLEAYSGIPYNAAMLAEAGICTSVNSDSPVTIRYMNLQAAMAIRWGGLNSTEALALITRNPAEQLGIADRVGTLAVGKDGDFAIFDGHPLDAFSRCVYTLIDGEVYFARPEPQRVAPHNPVQRAPQTFATVEVNSSGLYLLTGATIHPIASPDVENADLLIRDGRIARIAAHISTSGATTVDVKGAHVWPGLIDAGTQLGLSEILEIPATRDDREIARIQPELRALSAIHADSAHLAIARSAGITTALTRPAGGMVSGTSAIIDLTGWSTPEMIRTADFALHLDVPSLPLHLTGKRAKERRTQHEDAMKELTHFFRRARNDLHWRRSDQPAPPHDLRLEALAPYLAGDKPVVLAANSYKEIIDALDFAARQELRPIIYGGAEAWKCADVLAEKHIPVILASPWSYPRGDFEPYDSAFACAAALDAAGVKFCFGSDSAATAYDLPYMAGSAVAYGLPPERAMYALTLGAAEILGIDDEVGSLAPGKVANLIVTSDIPIQAIAGVSHMFIRGAPVDLNNLHTHNRDRFAARPTPDLPPQVRLVGPPALTRTPEANP